MSAVLALANPHRIKASHRRRWKGTTAHRVYAANNPYTVVDPDGRVAKHGMDSNACNETSGGCDAGSFSAGDGTSSAPGDTSLGERWQSVTPGFDSMAVNVSNIPTEVWKKTSETVNDVGMNVAMLIVQPEMIAFQGLKAIVSAVWVAKGAKIAEGVSKNLTYLYQKLGAGGEHLKYGITKNTATRYTQGELAGGRLKILAEGSRKDMLQLERNLHETLPIGSEEAQKFYIQKQIERGLQPPPYNP